MVGAISSSDPTGRSDVFLDASNYPNPDEGLMRGNLYSDTPGETYFFVLSNGHLSYYESQVRLATLQHIWGCLDGMGFRISLPKPQLHSDDGFYYAPLLCRQSPPW